MRLKTEAGLRALLILQDAAEDAAKVKTGGLQSKNEYVKQGASSDILDRVIGKPTQRVDQTVEQSNEIVITIKDIKRETDEEIK